jgi:hypothetical protein
MNYINGPSSHDQDFFEFRMSRSELFGQGNGGLVAVHPGEKEFATFMTHGFDAFDPTDPLRGQTVVLERCRACHSDSGIHSVQSRIRWMNESEVKRQRGNDESFSDTVTWETNMTVGRKQLQPDFNLLQRLWLAERD